jgi:hypothetical protein
MECRWPPPAWRHQGPGPTLWAQELAPAPGWGPSADAVQYGHLWRGPIAGPRAPSHQGRDHSTGPARSNTAEL